MNRRTFLAIRIALVAAVTIAAHLALRGWRSAIVGGGIAVVALMLASEMIRVLRSSTTASPAGLEAALAASVAPPARPADLQAMERILGWRSYSPAEFEHRVKPLLVGLHRHAAIERRGGEPTAEKGDFEGDLALLAPGAVPGSSVNTQRLIAIVQAIEEM